MTYIRSIGLLICLWLVIDSNYAQGVDLGISVGFGEAAKPNIGVGYDQNVSSALLSFYLRDYENNSHWANYYFMERRLDSIRFSNHAEYYREGQWNSFSTNAALFRQAYRFGYAKQLLIGKKPEKRNLGIGAGFFYEGTIYMHRKGLDLNYDLDDEINRHNIGFMFTTELKLRWFFIGYKYDRLFFDMLDHNHINSLEWGNDNPSELNGLNLSPETAYFYFGLNMHF